MKKLLKAIWNWLITIPYDKLWHGVVGAVVALFVFAICFRFYLPVWLCFVIADGAALAALVLKEIYDRTHSGHSAEWGDILAGSIGMLIVNAAQAIMVL